MLANLTFSRPVCRLDVENWPAGNRRVTARFRVVRSPEDWEQCSRVTTGKQRYSPRGAVVRVVVGSDAKHYVIGVTSTGKIFIMSGTMRKLKWLDPIDDQRLRMSITSTLCEAK